MNKEIGILSKILSGFSNSAPEYFRKMVSDDTGGFENMDLYWQMARQSRDWRLSKGIKHGLPDFSKSPFVTLVDTERAKTEHKLGYI